MAGIRLFRPRGLRRSVGLLRLENGVVLFEEFKRVDEQQEITRILRETPELQLPQLTTRTGDDGWGDNRNPETFDRNTLAWLREAVVQFVAPKGYTFKVVK